MFYLMTHSTYVIYGYMVNRHMVKDHSDRKCAVASTWVRQRKRNKLQEKGEKTLQKDKQTQIRRTLQKQTDKRSTKYRERKKEREKERKRGREI